MPHVKNRALAHCSDVASSLDFEIDIEIQIQVLCEGLNAVHHAVGREGRSTALPAKTRCAYLETHDSPRGIEQVTSDHTFDRKLRRVYTTDIGPDDAVSRGIDGEVIEFREREAETA